MSDDYENIHHSDGQVIEEQQEKVKEPEMYKVVLHNDHYTTMEFVTHVIMKVFRKSVIEATKIMTDVHKKGRGVIGVYTYDIASTKANQVRKLAHEAEFPLKCSVEPA